MHAPNILMDRAYRKWEDKENLLKSLELGNNKIRFVFSNANSRNNADSHTSLEGDKLGDY